MASEDDARTVATSPALSAVEVGRFVLRVTTGADAGKAFELDERLPARVLLGQSPVCEVRLSDPRVSRRHAAIELSGPRLRLTDLESTNGTVVNGLEIVDVFLAGGEQLVVGETTMTVERVGSSTVALAPGTGFGGIVGESVEMRRLYPLCKKLAASRVPVIIEGETGTGKEVLAEALHEMGARASAPFVVFDCTAAPTSLLESALFGHERGAFTGAVDSRKGVFEQAHGGTLFIDEIGDLDLPLQAKLLRALERLEVQRVGGDRWIKVDVRVLAATRRDLDREVQQGRFRDDLFYRLAVARIELPPLRRRRGDVTTLARHFWKHLGGSSAPRSDVLARLEAYSWPGNVRELHNTVARLIALGDDAEVGARRDASDETPTSGPQSASGDDMELILARDLPFVRARDLALEQFERRYVERALEKYAGNVTHAAAASGIVRRYFQTIRAKGQPKG